MHYATSGKTAVKLFMKELIAKNWIWEWQILVVQSQEKKRSPLQKTIWIKMIYIYLMD